MVTHEAVQASNAFLRSVEKTFTAVFVGGTSGIGRATIRALAATGARSRIYLIGRKSSQEPMTAFIRELRVFNPRAEVIWTEAEVSLLAEATRVCKDIAKKESRVDLLFMSAGYAPFGERKETSEGIEVTQSLEFYSRVVFIQLLLPLLSKSMIGRVVSVLAGGLESPTIPLEDLDLKEPGNFSGFKAQGHYAAMGTLTLEAISAAHPDVTFVHSFPGWVKTGNHRRGADPGSILARIVWPISEPLIRFMSMSVEESGDRHLFVSTSAMYGGRGTTWGSEKGVSEGKHGNGVFLVNQKCECVLNDETMLGLRRDAAEKVRSHTQRVIQAYI